MEVAVVDQRSRAHDLHVDAELAAQFLHQHFRLGLAPHVGTTSEIVGIDRRLFVERAANFASRLEHGETAHVNELLRAGARGRFDHVARGDDRVALMLVLPPAVSAAQCATSVTPSMVSGRFRRRDRRENIRHRERAAMASARDATTREL